MIDKNKKWIEAKKKFCLSDMHIQMARELGMNPKKFGSLANNKQEKWKSPLPIFIEDIYFKRFKKEFNYEEYGGAPLLGSNGAAIICHGDSSPKAIKNAIEKAHLMVERNISEHIRKRIQEIDGSNT